MRFPSPLSWTIKKNSELKNLQSIIDSVSKSYAVLELAVDGVVLYANPNYLDAVGYELDEIKGKHYAMLLDSNEEDSSEHQDLWRHLKKGIRQSRICKRIHKSGREVWINATYHPICDQLGTPQKIIVYAIDITEQKQADIMAKRISKALDVVGTNLMLADADFNIIYFNRMAGKLFHDAEEDIREELPGFCADKLLGANIDIFHKNPEHQRAMLSKLTDTFESEIRLGQLTFRIVANPIIADDGSRIGTVVEWEDRTLEIAIENEVQSLVDGAQSGGLTKRISLNNKTRFFSRLAESINNLVEVSERVVNDILYVLSAISDGELTTYIDAEYEGAFGELKTYANNTVAQLTDIVTQIKSASTSVNKAAAEISAGNLELNKRTQSQATALEQTASSMEEMTKTVKQNAASAQDANNFAIGAQNHAEEGSAVIEQAVKAMQSISDASNEISNIITLIDEIAFQTNLLSLNATVEAARAGEQGRGFAAVANEVRNLAGRAGSAAKEIKELINDSVEKIETGNHLVNESGKKLTAIRESVKQVTAIVGEISKASQEQSFGIEQANKAITEMEGTTQMNAALVEEASAAAALMKNQSNSLNQLVQFFKLSTDHKPNRGLVEPTTDFAERRSAERPWSQVSP